MAPEEAVPRGLTIDALYRTHVRAVYGFIYAKVGNRETAEDLTSEVFTKAVAYLDQERSDTSIVAWLYRVAHNAVNDYWRAIQRTPVIALDEARLLRRTLPSRETPRQEKTAARAAALLEHLPANYKQVLTCRLLDGLSVAETATKMATSEGNVKVLQHRALKRAAELREEGTPDER